MSKPAVRGAVFLDRDGTIIDDVHYIAKPELVVLRPGAGEAIATLNRARIPVIVVTNQSGIARGLVSEADKVRALHSVDVPAIRGSVLAWALAWFVLGYVLYATVYGALGSLGSRVEDAQAVAGPVMIVMALAYFASFTTIGQPGSDFARAISYFPLTAPMAMPGRIAMGAAAWWEPVLAAMITLAATAGLVQLAGRVYTRAILHSGPALSLRDIWRDKPR